MKQYAYFKPSQMKSIKIQMNRLKIRGAGTLTQ